MSILNKKYRCVSYFIMMFYKYICLSQVATAFQSTEPQWNSAAVSGLGGIGTLSENFVDQFFADPSLSAVPTSQNFQAQWFGLNIMYSRDLSSTAKDIKALVLGDTQSSSKVASVLSTVESMFGRRLTGSMNLNMASVRVRGIVIVPYVTTYLNTQIQVPSLPQVSVLGDVYTGVGLGFGREIRKNWDLGVSIRPGVRAYASASQSLMDLVPPGSIGPKPATSSDSSNSNSTMANYNAGFYMPVDLGFGYRGIPRTRLYLVSKNLGNAKPWMVLRKESDIPTYDHRLHIGGTYQAVRQGNHTLNLGTEFQDILKISETSGLWFRWQNALQYLYKPSFRTQTAFGLNCGLQSGYPSVGAFLDLIFVKLEATWYTQESGYYPGQSPERRYSFRLYSQLSF